MYDIKEATEVMTLLYQLKQCGERGKEKLREIGFVIQGAAFVAAQPAERR